MKKVYQISYESLTRSRVAKLGFFKKDVAIIRKVRIPIENGLVSIREGFWVDKDFNFTPDESKHWIPKNKITKVKVIDVRED